MIYQFLKIFSQRVFKLSSRQNFGFFSFLDPEIGPMVKIKQQTSNVKCNVVVLCFKFEVLLSNYFQEMTESKFFLI